MSNDDVFKNIEDGLSRFLPTFVEEFMPRVKRRTPVRSGTLQQGWEATVTETAAQIVNEVPYAAPVEYGTTHTAPRGMLRSTVEESEQIAQIAFNKVGLA